MRQKTKNTEFLNKKFGYMIFLFVLECFPCPLTPVIILITHLTGQVSIFTYISFLLYNINQSISLCVIIKVTIKTLLNMNIN